MMKNNTRFLVLITFIFTGYLVQAQLIVRGGLNMSNVPIKDQATNLFVETRNGSIGAQLGAVYEIYLTDNVSFEPGLQLSSKKFRSVSDNSIYKITSTFLETPFAMKYYFLETGDVRFYGLGGGIFGINLGTKINGKKLNIGNTKNDFFSPFDFALRIGTGIEINESILINYALETGLVNMTPAPLTAANGYKEKSITMRLSVGYKFN